MTDSIIIAAVLLFVALAGVTAGITIGIGIEREAKRLIPEFRQEKVNEHALDLCRGYLVMVRDVLENMPASREVHYLHHETETLLCQAESVSPNGGVDGQILR